MSVQTILHTLRFFAGDCSRSVVVAQDLRARLLPRGYSCSVLVHVGSGSTANGVSTDRRVGGHSFTAVVFTAARLPTRRFMLAITMVRLTLWRDTNTSILYRLYPSFFIHHHLCGRRRRDGAQTPQLGPFTLCFAPPQRQSDVVHVLVQLYSNTKYDIPLVSSAEFSAPCHRWSSTAAAAFTFVLSLAHLLPPPVPVVVESADRPVATLLRRIGAASVANRAEVA